MRWTGAQCILCCLTFWPTPIFAERYRRELFMFRVLLCLICFVLGRSWWDRFVLPRKPFHVANLYLVSVFLGNCQALVDLVGAWAKVWHLRAPIRLWWQFFTIPQAGEWVVRVPEASWWYQHVSIVFLPNAIVNARLTFVVSWAWHLEFVLRES